MLHRVSRCTVAALCVVLSSACYSYSAVSPTAVAPGTRIAADLTVRGSLDNEALLGADIDRVEGLLTSQTTDSTELQVIRTRSRQGSWSYWNGERLVLPFTAVASVRQRHFSVGRTSIAVGVAALAIVELLTGSLLGFGGDIGSSDPRPIPPVTPG